MKGSCLVARERIDWNTEERAREGRKGALSLSLLFSFSVLLFSRSSSEGEKMIFFSELARPGRKRSTLSSPALSSLVLGAFRSQTSAQSNPSLLSYPSSKGGETALERTRRVLEKAKREEKPSFFFKSHGSTKTDPPFGARQRRGKAFDPLQLF
jgi:hypothetical protein